MSTFGRSLSFVKTYPPNRPNLNANSGVNSLFATPRTPSVPKYFPILKIAPSSCILLDIYALFFSIVIFADDLVRFPIYSRRSFHLNVTI